MRKGTKLHDAERYAILAAVYEKEGTAVNQDSVGAYRTKTTRAGEFLYVACYPLISMGRKREQDEALERLIADRRHRTLVKYARYNNARRCMIFEQLVHANFGKGDFHVALTYEQPQYDLPMDQIPVRDREEAKRDLRNWLNRVKRMMKRHGLNPQDLRWLAVTVTKTHDREAPNPYPDVHHHHVLLGGIPEELRGEVERLWGFGYCNADRLQPDDKGIAAMAGYVARQEGSANGEHLPGEKSYSGSRNLKKPTVTTSDSRISRRRVAQIAADVRANAREVFAKVYPGYRLVEEPKVQTSDFVAGAYIYAKLRIKDGKPHAGGAKGVMDRRKERVYEQGTES